MFKSLPYLKQKYFFGYLSLLGFRSPPEKVKEKQLVAIA